MLKSIEIRNKSKLARILEAAKKQGRSMHYEVLRDLDGVLFVLFYK